MTDIKVEDSDDNKREELFIKRTEDGVKETRITYE